jgi:hypothetical protein
MTSRKKPGVAFWATVAPVVLVVAYPLSVGPAEWLNRSGRISDNTGNVIRQFYRPLDWTYRNGPESIRQSLDWYIKLWTR